MKTTFSPDQVVDRVDRGDDPKHILGIKIHVHVSFL